MANNLCSVKSNPIECLHQLAYPVLPVLGGGRRGGYSVGEIIDVVPA